MGCYNLNEELSIRDVGEKAFQLSQMKRSGLPVPNGIVLGDSVFKTRDLSSVKHQITSFVEANLANGFMVRSSAIGEDGSDASFAGQLDSFIAENRVEDIFERVYQCWDSYSAENVNQYQEAKGKKLEGMGVIIQELIEPDFAGVLFTESHLAEKTIIVEYVEGHSEKLVSGEVNPFSFTVDKTKQVPSEEVPFPTDQLISFSLELERTFERAIDMEWVVKNNKLFIVQCRPITTRGFVPKIYWSNTNVNENYPEAITPLLYSIARESYYHYFKNLSKLLQLPSKNIQELEREFSNIIGVWGAKMYYNMSSIHRIISKSPFSKLLMKSFNNFVGYQEGEKENSSPVGFKNKLLFLWKIVQLNKNLTFHVNRFESIINDYKNDLKSSFDHVSLQKSFHDFIEIRMHSWYHASVADFFAMIYHGVLGSLCTKYYGDEAERIRNELIQAIPNLVSSKPVQETWLISNQIKENNELLNLFTTKEASEIWSELKSNSSFKSTYKLVVDYINNWGYRCSGELMLSSTNYMDDPSKYIQLLKGYVVQVHRNPSELIDEKHNESLKTLRAFKKKIYSKQPILFPLNWLRVRWLGYVVKQTQKGISSRERVRLKQALLYSELKTVLRRIARLYPQRFKTKEDLYLLKYGEIQEMLSASEMLPEFSIEERRAQFLKTSKLIYPDDFQTPLGQYVQPQDLCVEHKNTNGQVLKGLTACGGTIKGRARVLDSVLEADKLVEGDILITRQTDPGWASVFPLISGLVVERGGMLSHGAIVSREFGIPAVVGVQNVTDRIKDGSTIEVKADSGEIRLDA